MGLINKMLINFELIMKQQRTPKIHSKPTALESEITEIDSELKVINRILDKRHEVLVELS